MRFLFLMIFFYINIFANEVFNYSLQELAYTVSQTNKINIVIDSKLDNEKLFFFSDALDKDLSFDAFNYMLRDINYEIFFNGKFYYITKNSNDKFKFYYAKNPNISDKKLELLSKKFELDLSLSDANQIVVKYQNLDSLENFKIYLENYKPIKQVFLEGEILAVNETLLNDIGIDFASIASTIKATGSFDIGLFSNVNANDAVMSILSSHSGSIGDISLFINLLHATGSSKVVTRPNMLIRSGNTSTFKSGKQIRIITGSTDSIRNTGEYSSKQYELLDLGLTLSCDAVIYDNNIDLKFKFSVKDVTTYKPALDELIIDNKSYESDFYIENNSSIILAGLTSTSKSHDVYALPFLSDIPYIGEVFTHETTSNDSISYLIYFKATIQ